MTPLDAEQVRTRLDALAALLNARRYDEALAASDAMLGADLIHPLPLAVSATARQQAGQFDEAIVLWRRRAQLMAAEAQGWVPLAVCLFAARRPELALEAWDRALALAPADPAILAGKAGTLRGLGQSQAARALYRQALAAAPDNSRPDSDWRGWRWKPATTRRRRPSRPGFWPRIPTTPPRPSSPRGWRSKAASLPWPWRG